MKPWRNFNTVWGELLADGWKQLDDRVVQNPAAPCPTCRQGTFFLRLGKGTATRTIQFCTGCNLATEVTGD
jgi:hypothetical protein